MERERERSRRGRREVKSGKEGGRRNGGEGIGRVAKREGEGRGRVAKGEGEAEKGGGGKQGLEYFYTIA